MAALPPSDDYIVQFLVSPGDDDQSVAVKEQPTWNVNVEFEPGPGDYARKINHGYRLAESHGFDWVFTGADDLTFHPGWLQAAMLVAANYGKSVIGTNDLWNPSVRRGRHSTHSLVSVDYVREIGGGWDGPGVLLHEGYDHQCVDNELCTAALMRGMWAFAKDSVVEHLHPFAKKAEMDDTYRKALAKGKEDIAVFRQRWRNAQAQQIRERRSR
jgi:hypothetical protein